MIISNENSFPVILDSVSIPLITSHFWVMDMKQDDFFLKKLAILSQYKCALFTLNVNNHLITIPVDWYILIYSAETSQLDLIQASELTYGNYSALLYNHKRTRTSQGNIRVVDYNQNCSYVSPIFSKYEMVCHALGPDNWLMMTNMDIYNRYIKNKLLGNFI